MECNVPTDIVFSFSGSRCGAAFAAPTPTAGSRALRGACGPDVPRARGRGELEARCLHPQSSIKTLLANRPRAKAHAPAPSRSPTRIRSCASYGPTLHLRAQRNGACVKRHKLGRYRPIGTTDSEYAFCTILNRLDRLFPSGYPRDSRPALSRHRQGRQGARRERNLQLSPRRRRADVRACATKLCYIVRRGTFPQRRRSPTDDTHRRLRRWVTTPRDRVAIIATARSRATKTWTMGRPEEMWSFAVDSSPHTEV